MLNNVNNMIAICLDISKHRLVVGHAYRTSTMLGIDPWQIWPEHLSTKSPLWSGHIKLNRTDRRSMMNCLLESQRLLNLGASILFFPEGTRSTSQRMAAFKKVNNCLKKQKYIQPKAGAHIPWPESQFRSAGLVI